LYDLLQQGHPCEQSLFTHRWRCNERWFPTRVIARADTALVCVLVSTPRNLDVHLAFPFPRLGAYLWTIDGCAADLWQWCGDELVPMPALAAQVAHYQQARQALLHGMLV
jgi:hypothetical protein